MFPESEIPLPAALLVFLAVGPGYAAGGYYAFKSTVEITPAELIGTITLFAWGSLINCAADMYKSGAKSAKPGATVTTGPYRLARHLNWFGDWLRYASFALVGRGYAHPLACFPLAWTLLFNLTSLAKRREGQAKRGAAAQKYLDSTPAVIPWRLFF